MTMHDRTRAYPAPTDLRGRPSSVKKAKGHEMVLNSIQSDGRKITVELLDSDDYIQGSLVAHDKYTLSVEVGDRVEIIYKHAIRKFYAERRKVLSVPKAEVNEVVQ